MVRLSVSRVKHRDITESAHNRYWEVRGAGSRVCNGLYLYAGMCNDRPYYLKADGSAALWYFFTAFPASLWNGWYISKQANTSALTSADDYYTAYVHGPLPPMEGWVTRLPGMNITDGCGADPPPSLSCPEPEDASTDERNLPTKQTEQLVIHGDVSSPPFPDRYSVTGAGSQEADGVYGFCQLFNNRPCYKKIGGEESLWYFADCPLCKSTLGLMNMNGWYLSKSVGTSSASAADDYYSQYQHGFLPTDAEWVVRSSGIGPFAGSGATPAPSVEPIDDTMLVALRVQAPNGRLHTEVIDVAAPVNALLIKLQQTTGIPVHSLRISVRNRFLPSDQTISNCYIQQGDILALSEVTPLPRSVGESPLHLVIVGAGPVGLWLAIQMKIRSPAYRITCLEKRQAYQRSHALRIDSYAFEGMVQWEPGQPFAAELKLLTERWRPRTRTSMVENQLRTLATHCGVQLQNGVAITDLQQLLVDYAPNAVIGCDGVNSICRRAICPSGHDEYAVARTLGALMQIKFDAPGEVRRKVGSVAQFSQNLDGSDQFFNVLPGNFDEQRGVTPVTAFCLINDEIAASMSEHGYTSASPCVTTDSLEAATQNPTVARDIIAIMQNTCPEIVEDTLKISVLPVEYRVASHVTGTVDGVPVFVVGDAALSLALEKGLNHGWMIASRLAAYLCYCNSFDQAICAYDAYFQTVAARAITLVDQDYQSYLGTVRLAGIARSLVHAITMRPIAAVGEKITKNTMAFSSVSSW